MTVAITTLAAILAFAVVVLFGLVNALKGELVAKDAQIAELTLQRDDWKGKAERLIDANLARAGAIHQPTMEYRKPQDRVAGAASMMTAALAITEIDSRESRKKTG